MSENSSKTNEETASQVNGAEPSTRVARVAGVDVERLCAVVERIEAIEAEIRSLNEDKSEVYREAKERELDLKALRQVIRWRRLSRDDQIQEDYTVDLYKRALAGLLAKAEVAAPHEEAFAAGKADALARVLTNAHRWANGEYGHADYHLGYAEGEQERDSASRVRAREASGAAA